MELLNRIKNMIARAVINLVKDNSGLQSLQASVLDNEPLEVQRLQQYGFSSVPLSGAEALIIFRGGNRSDGIAVSVDDRRYRPTGSQAGDVIIYDHRGNKITLSDTLQIEAVSSIDITAPDTSINGDVTITGNLTVSAPIASITGNVNITGDLTVSGNLISGSTNLSLHTHHIPDDGYTEGPQ